ncbi:MAG: hypothetical protein KG029_04695 [Bacteroidetes bacterium]|nr:hypothetical protein [Bacteroidota bacterium]
MNPYIKPGMELSEEDIIQVVASFYKLPASSLRKANRRRNIVEPRQIILFLLVTLCDSSYERSASFFDKNHSTAVYSIKMVKALYQTDKEFRSNFQEILEQLNLSEVKRKELLTFVQSRLNWGEFKKKQS